MHWTSQSWMGWTVSKGKVSNGWIITYKIEILNQNYIAFFWEILKSAKILDQKWTSLFQKFLKEKSSYKILFFWIRNDPPLVFQKCIHILERKHPSLIWVMTHSVTFPFMWSDNQPLQLIPLSKSSPKLFSLTGADSLFIHRKSCLIIGFQAWSSTWNLPSCSRDKRGWWFC